MRLNVLGLGLLVSLPVFGLSQPRWPGYGGDPQHSARSSVSAQNLQSIIWSSPVDLMPQYSGDSLLIHYGSPLVTHNNTVIVTVKTGAYDGFKLEGRCGASGQLLWTQTTDYSLPPSGWIASCGSTLTPDNKLVFPGAGGTVWIRTNPDQTNGNLTRVAFFGNANYAADPAAYNNSVKICTPITCDAAGNLYFGYWVYASNPLGLESGIARISASGVGTYVPAHIAANDGNIAKIPFNCAPALSNDGTKVYVGANTGTGSGFGVGYLLCLNSTTLAQESRVLLTDPRNASNLVYLPDDGTASPTVGPDGDVFYGVLENPFGSNHVRGWMMHFNADLSVTRDPGAFGWDNTPSIVPASAVPSYSGTSSYLLLTKYNNYVEGGGDGVNKLAILDPNADFMDPISGACVMAEVYTIAGPTPDDRFRPEHPNAVREWCINTGAVDPAGHCALVNNEDGKLYRWDFNTNTLTQVVTLTAGIGEAYTPTAVGPDGQVYAINNATLYAVGLTPATITGTITLEDCLNQAQPVTFEFRTADNCPPIIRTATLSASGSFSLSGIPRQNYTLWVKGAKWLAKTVSVNASGGSVSGVSVSLTNGDCDDDNEVTLVDYGILSASFNTTVGDDNWNPGADLNCDDEVNLADYAILARNFGRSGD